jgi:hypothetical protein
MALFRNMQEPESTDITQYPGYVKLSGDQQKKVAETYTNVYNNNQGRLGYRVAQGIAFETAKKMCESFVAEAASPAAAARAKAWRATERARSTQTSADHLKAQKAHVEAAKLHDGAKAKEHRGQAGVHGSIAASNRTEGQDPAPGLVADEAGDDTVDKTINKPGPTYEGQVLRGKKTCGKKGCNNAGVEHVHPDDELHPHGLTMGAMERKYGLPDEYLRGKDVTEGDAEDFQDRNDALVGMTEMEDGVISGANPEEDGAAKLLRLNHDKMCLGCGAVHPLDVMCFNGRTHSEAGAGGGNGAGDILKQNHAQKGMKVEDSDPEIAAAARYLTNRAKISGLMESLEEGAGDIQKKNVGQKCPDCGAMHDPKDECNNQSEPDTDKETEKEVDDASKILKKNHTEKGLDENLDEDEDDPIMGGLKKHANRQLLKYAAGHHIFCPSCKNVLDHKNTVIATHKGTGKTSVSCGDCYDKGINKLKVRHGHDVINKHVHDNFDVVDGRSPKKQAKEPKPEKPEGALKKPQHVKGQGSFRFKPGVKVESEELGEDEIEEGLKRNLLWAKDAVQIGARNLGRDIKADGLKKAVKSGIEDAKSHYKMKGESEEVTEKHQHVGWDNMVKKLEGEGKSAESAAKIAGAIKAKGPHANESEEEGGPSCPDCGSSDVSFHPYDFGKDSGTGYHDAGERYHCHGCGSKGDGDDAAPKMKKLKEAIEQMWAENFYPAKPLEESCGNCSHPKSYHAKACQTCNECTGFVAENTLEEKHKKDQICFCGHEFGGHSKGGCKVCKHEGVVKPERAAHQFKKNDWSEKFESDYAKIFAAQQGKINTTFANARLNWLPEELELTEGKGYEDIGPGDHVKFNHPLRGSDKVPQQGKGRVVMKGPAGWVLNTGGKHGTPAIVSPENYVSHRKAKKRMTEDEMIDSMVENDIQESNNYPDYHEVLNKHGYKSKGWSPEHEGSDEGHHTYTHADGSHVTLHSNANEPGHFHSWKHKGKNKKLVGNSGDSPKSLDSHLKGVARAHRSGEARKDREATMKSLGLNKVKGSVSGKTYWESEEQPVAEDEKPSLGKASRTPQFWEKPMAPKVKDAVSAAVGKPVKEEVDPLIAATTGYIKSEVDRAGGPTDLDEWKNKRSEFANPGSALRAASKSNPRNLPCPTCKQENKLTPKDKAKGYQCDDCANMEERGW